MDDIGVGVELQNLHTVRGTLTPAALDAVNLFHFDVARRSDVRLRLANARDRQFAVQLLSDSGAVLAISADEINRRVERGRCVVAVRGRPMTKAGRHALSLAVRQLTKTELEASAKEIPPRSPLTLTITLTPPPRDGWVDIQIDRFDPLTGWQFNRKLRVRAVERSVTWVPRRPAAGGRGRRSWERSSSVRAGARTCT